MQSSYMTLSCCYNRKRRVIVTMKNPVIYCQPYKKALFCHQARHRHTHSVQNGVRSVTECRCHDVWNPPLNQTLIIFIDPMNQPPGRETARLH